MEALVVDACDAPRPDQPVTDDTGPSIPLLRAAVGYLGDLPVVASPFVMTLPEHPIEFAVEGGGGSLTLNGVATLEDGGVRIDLDLGRTGSDGDAKATWADVFVPQDGLVVLAGPGCTLLYVAGHTIESEADMVWLAKHPPADVARHFEGLSPKAARKRASELLAVSPTTSLLL